LCRDENILLVVVVSRQCVKDDEPKLHQHSQIFLTVEAVERE